MADQKKPALPKSEAEINNRYLTRDETDEDLERPIRAKSLSETQQAPEIVDLDKVHEALARPIRDKSSSTTVVTIPPDNCILTESGEILFTESGESLETEQ